jgi:hypothetical protein
VDSISAVGTVVGSFTIRKNSALKPTTAGRALDVSATGEAGLDWANIGSPTTTVGLSGTTVKTATDVETDTQDIQARLPAALVSGRIDSSVGAMASGVLTATAIAADAITDAKVAADVTIASVTGAVGSVTGAVGSVTGNVGGNVTGSVGSVVGAVGSVTGNVGGNVTGSVGSVATGGIASTSFATGAITATAIAADAIGASELAADAVTEIQSGLATATNVSAVTTAISALLPAALVGGRIDASVGAMAADVVTASAIAADAIGSSELAASAATEIGTAVWAKVLEGTLTADVILRIVAAAVAGKSTGNTFRNLSDTQNQIVGTVASGDRTAATYGS